VAGAVILGLLYDGKPYLFLNLAMAALVAAVCIRKDQPLLALLSCSPVRYVGTISYGMYLLHVLAMNVAERILKIHHPVYEFLITVPLTLGLAALSHLSFESWFLRQRSSPSALSLDGLRRAVQWCLRRQPQADAVLVKIYLGGRRT
jgi:peptidoglycan/LPS O-acetylase OafA/YrhL